MKYIFINTIILECSKTNYKYVQFLNKLALLHDVKFIIISEIEINDPSLSYFKDMGVFVHDYEYLHNNRLTVTQGIKDYVNNFAISNDDFVIIDFDWLKYVNDFPYSVIGLCNIGDSYYLDKIIKMLTTPIIERKNSIFDFSLRKEANSNIDILDKELDRGNLLLKDRQSLLINGTLDKFFK